MSLTLPGNDNIQYPTLRGIPSTSAKTANTDTVTNSNTQGLMNYVSGGNADNNTDSTSKNASNESPNTANQESGQPSGTTRQTRSSAKRGKVALESLGPTEDLSRSQLDQQQHYEIERIIDGGPDEALGQFHHEDKAAMTQVYKQLALLTHPDKQTSDWKEKATKAQSSEQGILTKGSNADHKIVLNDARDKFDLSIVTPEEIGRPKDSHKIFWDTSPFVGSVQHLHIDPSSQKARGFIQKVNSDIEAHNRERNYSANLGKFPLKYLQDKYKDTQTLRKTYKDTNNPEKKNELAAIFQALCVATQEFCDDRGLPKAWAWPDADVDKEPAWLSEAEEVYSNLNDSTGDDLSNSTETAREAVDSSSTEPGNDPGPVMGSGTDAGSGDGDGDSDGDGDDTEMEDVNEALEKLTLDGEPVISKRPFFDKGFQYLVEESSGLHVWKLAELCGDLEPEDIPSVEKKTKQFVDQHKRKYKSMRWIAMSVDNAVILGAGRYPSISIMAEWQGNLEDTLLSRSDLIRIAGQPRVDRDLQSHLPHQKQVVFEGRQVYVMSPTQPGLLNGEMKAMQQIKKDQFKTAKAMQNSLGPQLGAFQSNAAQPAANQPFVPQVGVNQVGVQPGIYQPFGSQTNTQPGLVWPHAAQQGIPTLGQQAIPQTAIPQTGATQPGVAQPNQTDMIPSSAIQAIIAAAVQQAIQQYLPQPTLPVAA